jgi:hypothetical protein
MLHWILALCCAGCLDGLEADPVSPLRGQETVQGDSPGAGGWAAGAAARRRHGVLCVQGPEASLGAWREVSVGNSMLRRSPSELRFTSWSSRSRTWSTPYSRSTRRRWTRSLWQRIDASQANNLKSSFKSTSSLRSWSARFNKPTAIRSGRNGKYAGTLM